MRPAKAVRLSVFWLRAIYAHPANRGARLTALRRVLRWELATRLGSATHADITIADATVLRVIKDQWAAVWSLYDGLHEWEELQFCLRYLRPGDHFIDVGANVGVFTCIVGSRVGGLAITAIEPFPPIREVLRHNVERNGLSQSVSIPDGAVGAAAGQATFEVLKHDVHNRLAPGGVATVGKGLTVVVHTLDDLVGAASVALIKIDVEGGELDVLRGAERLLSGPNPPVVIFECVDLTETFGHEKADVLRYMRSLGFSIFLLDGCLTPWDSDASPTTPNVVATRSPEEMRRRLADGAHEALRAPVRVDVDYGSSPRL